jgi:hypothetical protein
MIELAVLEERVALEFSAPLLVLPSDAHGVVRASFVGSRPGRSYAGRLGPWLAGLRERAAAGETVVCLVPARTDTGWWWEHCRYGEVRFLRGRVRFGGERSGAPFPSAVVVFDPAAEAELTGWWDVESGELTYVPTCRATEAAS